MGFFNEENPMNPSEAQLEALYRRLQHQAAHRAATRQPLYALNLRCCCGAQLAEASALTSLKRLQQSDE